MTKILLSLLISLVIGCGDSGIYNGRPVIVSKFRAMNGWGYDSCLCEFSYRGMGHDSQQFTDSCNKYNIGDTIKYKSK